jgi:site-specific DNA-methyltransferase (adenine-specific)
LGELADRVLKPGGSLIAMTGQLYLPRYLELLSKHLTYHWTLAYTTPGGQAVQVWNKEVNTFWKPLLWFVKGERDSRWVSDVINTPINANDKDHHHWGQGEAGMTAIVERFSNPGDVVLDPFLGGGTTGVVCKALKRTFIGVEIDCDVAEQATKRIHKGAA